jgi:hypothetical protein
MWLVPAGAWTKNIEKCVLGLSQDLVAGDRTILVHAAFELNCNFNAIEAWLKQIHLRSGGDEPED